jgi:hypothetical protein
MKNLQVVFPLQQAGWNWADMVSFLMLISFSVTLAFKAFFTLANSTFVSISLPLSRFCRGPSQTPS